MMILCRKCRNSIEFEPPGPITCPRCGATTAAPSTGPRAGPPAHAPGRHAHALGTGYHYAGDRPPPAPERNRLTDLEPGDYVFALLLVPLACITGLIWIAQGKRTKGLKMLGLCLVFGLVERFILKVIFPQY